MARITDIHCPQCGAPAYYEIEKQAYRCSHCGSPVTISEAIREKQGFRQLRRGKLKDDAARFKTASATCSGCGATVAFEEHEALTSCAFCGRSLVRSEYLDIDGLPESVIPFAITESEAQERLREWCDRNKGKPEAKKLKKLIPGLKGFYLPY